jgi:adenosylcobinamide kinase/adenosylcobinamide-phosphate guanylyltransferase
MRVLVVGGSGSGKSAYAEQLACSLSPRRTYVATMESQSAEAQRRIARHRAQRDGLGFITIECSRALPVGDWPKHPRFQSATPTGVALVEDLGNLVANALFAPDESMGDPRAVVDKLERNVLDFSRAYEHVVVVGNLVGCEGASVYEATREWVRAVGTLCCRLAAAFDVVVEITAGIPQVIKGTLP